MARLWSEPASRKGTTKWRKRGVWAVGSQKESKPDLKINQKAKERVRLTLKARKEQDLTVPGVEMVPRASLKVKINKKVMENQRAEVKIRPKQNWTQRGTRQTNQSLEVHLKKRTENQKRSRRVRTTNPKEWPKVRTVSQEAHLKAKTKNQEVVRRAKKTSRSAVCLQEQDNPSQRESKLADRELLNPDRPKKLRNSDSQREKVVKKAERHRIPKKPINQREEVSRKVERQKTRKACRNPRTHPNHRSRLLSVVLKPWRNQQLIRNLTRRTKERANRRVSRVRRARRASQAKRSRERDSSLVFLDLSIQTCT